MVLGGRGSEDRTSRTRYGHRCVQHLADGTHGIPADARRHSLQESIHAGAVEVDRQRVPVCRGIPARIQAGRHGTASQKGIPCIRHRRFRWSRECRLDAPRNGLRHIRERAQRPEEGPVGNEVLLQPQIIPPRNVRTASGWERSPHPGPVRTSCRCGVS